MFHVVLSDVSSVDEALAKVREKAGSLKPGEWLVGAEGLHREGMRPSRTRRSESSNGIPIANFSARTNWTNRFLCSGPRGSACLRPQGSTRAARRPFSPPAAAEWPTERD
jgi:hypothetical protein